MPDALPFAAALLAGGRSVRMGRDKALLDWHGRPLWQVQVAKLQALFPQRTLIACRRDQGFAGSTSCGDVEWVLDPDGEELGPVAALDRCLRLSGLPLLVLAVDMPWMTAEFLREAVLGRAIAGRGRFFERGGRSEPLAGLYAPAMLPQFAAALAQGKLSLQGVVAAAVAAGCADVDELPEQAVALFRNANTPGDLECRAEM